MSVEIEPLNENCFSMGLSNGTWFTICNGPLIDIVGEQRTNDPMNVGAEDAHKCAHALENWIPPTGWFSEGKEQEGKAMLINFFYDSGGFTTH